MDKWNGLRRHLQRLCKDFETSLTAKQNYEYVLYMMDEFDQKEQEIIALKTTKNQ